MSAFNFADLAKELTENSNEEGLSFEDLQKNWSEAEDVKDVVSALETQKVVHYLKLNGNTLGVAGAAAIGKALEKHPEFYKALWKDMFTGRLKAEIPEALKNLGKGLIIANARLTVLDLSDNALGPNGMAGLEELLRSSVCYTLQELRLNNCGLGIGGGQMLSKAILDCHRNSTEAGKPLKLKMFVAGRNRLENDGAKAIAKIFSTLKTLEEITMPQNSIYHIGIQALAEGIKHNPNLKVLNLNDNTVASKGASYLADAFAYIPGLREINFGDCLLKTNGAYNFADALEENHHELEIVNLGFNEIGVDGGLVLITALKNKPKLRKLILDGNQFGRTGCEAIKNALRCFKNPDVLEEMLEDQSEIEDDEDLDEENGDDGDEDYDEGNIDETFDEEDELYDDHHNDTTEEVEEDEDYVENTNDKTAYTTNQDFASKMLNTNESIISSKNITSSIATYETFCLSQKPCPLQMFDSLRDSNKLKGFMEIINQFQGDNHLLLLVFTALKCAHLAQSSAEALELAVALYQETADYAVQTKQERRITNYLLMQLGLLRCEEKFHTEYNMKSCRFALRQTLSKKSIDSVYMKNTFQVFLNQLDV
ncbi:ran GTPase-activating protein [Glossina fuscipes]|uniref:Ran GTPase-activating protein n=1 Tax=Glossina fuscipes TaxID=7396 RepID=A0A9C5ZD98_9MUSC|nr:ran GTPase-activating protein [Glossina fuscipes]